VLQMLFFYLINWVYREKIIMHLHWAALLLSMLDCWDVKDEGPRAPCGVGVVGVVGGGGSVDRLISRPQVATFIFSWVGRGTSLPCCLKIFF
jgi:hypothetical protein